MIVDTRASRAAGRARLASRGVVADMADDDVRGLARVSRGRFGVFGLLLRTPKFSPFETAGLMVAKAPALGININTDQWPPAPD